MGVGKAMRNPLAVAITSILLAVLASCFLKKKKKTMIASIKPDRPSSVESAPSTSGNDYKVFLSFQGGDTRTGFTDHLYNSLVNAGVSIFGDYNELHIGSKSNTNSVETPLRLSSSSSHPEASFFSFCFLMYLAFFSTIKRPLSLSFALPIHICSALRLTRAAPTPPPTSEALASDAASALASDASDADDKQGPPLPTSDVRHLRRARSTASNEGQDVLLLNTGLGNEEDQKYIKELLQVEISGTAGDSNEQPLVSWLQDDRHKHEAIRLRHFKTVTSVEWHRKGDYLSTMMPADILVVECFMMMCLFEG
ncbi:hypothetical protein NL676_008780 [Syzygium grande]|nr:hypothetical protein NL676_008780 [Syzygium grande]